MKNIKCKAERWVGRVGERIRGERKVRGLSMQAAADAADMHWRHWQKIELGEGNPCLVTLYKIACALGLHPAALIEGE